MSSPQHEAGWLKERKDTNNFPASVIQIILDRCAPQVDKRSNGPLSPLSPSPPPADQ